MAQATRVQMVADLEQLSALLGRRVQKIRKTDEDPPRVAIIDVVMVITGQGAKNSARAFARVAGQYPEVSPTRSDFKFPGRGQKNTPVADVRGIVESGRTPW